MRPHAKLAKNTMNRRNPRYVPGDIDVNVMVDKASSVKTATLISSDDTMRVGYEAFDCIFVRISIATKFVAVEIERIADWKCVLIHASDSKRCWK